jgi:hypothetical protein
MLLLNLKDSKGSQVTVKSYRDTAKEALAQHKLLKYTVVSPATSASQIGICRQKYPSGL